jgi:hypothetical protein
MPPYPWTGQQMVGEWYALERDWALRGCPTVKEIVAMIEARYGPWRDVLAENARRESRRRKKTRGGRVGGQVSGR